MKYGKVKTKRINQIILTKRINQIIFIEEKRKRKKKCISIYKRLTHSFRPAPVAQWLARRTVGRKVWGSNPIRVMWDFSALAGSYPELGVLWAQWEGWNHTAELHPLNGCVFEGVALIT